MDVLRSPYKFISYWLLAQQSLCKCHTQRTTAESLTSKYCIILYDFSLLAEITWIHFFPLLIDLVYLQIDRLSPIEISEVSSTFKWHSKKKIDEEEKNRNQNNFDFSGSAFLMCSYRRWVQKLCAVQLFTFVHWFIHLITFSLSGSCYKILCITAAKGLDFFNFFCLHIGGMPNKCSKDCLGIRYRTNSLHQTWKWLHQTIELHEYLISMSSADSDAKLPASTFVSCA